MILSWYEQKAVAILLTLLHLGIKDIRLGPSLPAFVTPGVLGVLVENFGIRPIGESPREDLVEILGDGYAAVRKRRAHPEGAEVGAARCSSAPARSSCLRVVALRKTSAACGYQGEPSENSKRETKSSSAARYSRSIKINRLRS